MQAALTFGEWLKRRRGGLGLTQKELARQVGYAEVTLRKIEADELRPSREMAQRLAEALQVPEDERARFVHFARDEGQWDKPDLETAVLPIPPAEVVHLGAEPDQSPAGADDSVEHPSRLKLVTVTQQVDWGEAPDVGRFQGRQHELAQLHRWLVNDQCKVVAVLGMGGIGKTALATLAAANVQEQFTAVIWRSLRNAPPLGELLGQCIQIVSNHAEHELPTSIRERQTLLLEYLRGQRCLLVLDNFETMLQAEQPGQYLPGYEGYGQLLKHLGEGRHQSCLLLTSREKPKELIPLADDTGPVRTLSVTSLEIADSRALLKGRDLRANDAEWGALHARYSGNPLALQIVADTIRELFDGSVGHFLAQETLLFGGIDDLLAEQTGRLSPLEQEVMFWLAVEREPVTAEELGADFVQRPALPALLAALHALRQRSLVERAQGGFTLQNVVLEYFTATLVKQVCEEIRLSGAVLLQHYALLKATAKSYVRDSQRNLILAPVAERLVVAMSLAGLIERFEAILSHLRYTQPRQPGYAGGNLLNLLVHLDIDLRGWDFSQLAVWQADLRNVTAHDIDFHQADLAHSTFTDTFAAVYSVVFSPDGKRLAAATKGNEIGIWNASDGQPLLTWESHSGWVHSVCYSPDGHNLASGGGDSVVRLWDALDGRHLATMRRHTKYVLAVCFSPDGNVVASGSADHMVGLWDRHTGECLHILHGHTGGVSTICFSPDGNILASGSNDRTVLLWDRDTGLCLHSLQGHLDWIRSVCFSSDGMVLASSSDDHTVRLWDRYTGACLHTMQGHAQPVSSVYFSPNGELLASGSNDHAVRIWDRHSGECLHVLQGHTDWVRSVCFSPDANVLASSSYDHTVRLWDSHSGRCLHLLQGHTSWVRSICFSPNGNVLASGSDDPSLRLWDSHTGECLHTMQGYPRNIWSVCFSPSGDGLASGSDDPTVRLWDISTGQTLHILRGHTDAVKCVCFSPDGHALATASDDQTARLWDRYTGECLQTLQGHTNAVRSVCFSPDGHVLASSGDDQTVRLWDSQSGACLHTMHGHVGWVRSVCFSPDGSVLASGSDDQMVRLWDRYTGQCLYMLQGHTGRVMSVCFSADGSILASSSSDQTVRLWNRHTGECLNTLEGHTNAIRSICVSPDGNVLASGGSDETIRLWDMTTGKCLRILRGDRPYERMNISGVTGLTTAQIATLRRLGAVDNVGTTDTRLKLAAP